MPHAHLSIDTMYLRCSSAVDCARMLLPNTFAALRTAAQNSSVASSSSASPRGTGTFSQVKSSQVKSRQVRSSSSSGWSCMRGTPRRAPRGAPTARSRTARHARPPQGHHLLLHAPPAPHLARRSDRPSCDRRGVRRGAPPRRHLGEIQEISPP